MAAFIPITRPEALPGIGSSTRERLSLELKRRVLQSGRSAAEEQFELAKDVAALANATGGVILVGAIEDGATGHLHSYAPMPEGEARETAEAYNRAVRDRCAPPPLLDASVLAQEGEFVVAVNVWPYPGQPVGVRSATSTDTFAFPLRVGVHTRFLRPEQLPMLMHPAGRRAWILLESIPPTDRANVSLTDAENIAINVELTGVEPLKNTVEFIVRSYRDRLHIPLDAIGSVWLTETGAWCVTLEGVLESESAYDSTSGVHYGRPRFRGKRRL